MTARFEVYRCEICGNIVEVLVAGAGKLVCCGKNMIKLVESKEEKGYEKHLPVAERTEHGLKVKVGGVPHPMDENHYIAMVEMVTEKGVHRRYLNPGDSPEALFCSVEEKPVALREYCTVHGLWRNDKVGS